MLQGGGATVGHCRTDAVLAAALTPTRPAEAARNAFGYGGRRELGRSLAR